MALPRESTLLPTIKCSACGGQVEISMMGEHLCGPATPELSPPMEAEETFKSAYQATRNRYLRTPPPVDTSAASRSANRGQLTPVSNSGSSRNASPKTPSGRMGLNRSRDDYAPEIATHDDGPRSPRGYGRRPGGYGGLDRQDSTGSDDSSSRDPLPKQQLGGFLERIHNLPPNSLDAGRRPSASRNGFPQRKDSLDHWDPPPDLTLTANNGPRQPARKNGYGGFDKVARDEPSMKPPPPMNRADTFPKPAPLGDIGRRPSAPDPRAGPQRQPSMGPDTSRKPPPRTSLISHSKSPSVDLAAEFGERNPYHTPSDSMSSGYSTMSHESMSTSRSHPDTTVQRNGSDPYNRVNPTSTRAPPRGNGRPTDLRIDPAVQAPLRSAMIESPYGVSPRDDRYDPAIQSGRPAPSPLYGSMPRDDGYGGGGYSNDRLGNSLPRSANMRQPSREPIIPHSRGDCKACKIPITGKSISSADGRLTGKYHKACFVCTTCTAPFMSAEFYVHSDQPYCELHYHELNGSLCGSCGRGIEGQYAEDEGRVKYHIGCFRCLDCGISLSDGYFEVDGDAYCERDAWKRVEQHAAPPVPPMPDAGAYPPPLPTGQAVPRMPNGHAPRGAAGMQRGPYGVAPTGSGKPTKLQKRMTRIGMM